MGKDDKKSKDKGKKRKKEKDKKEKHEKKKRRRLSTSSSSSDDDVETAQQQLLRERAAVGKLRDILSAYPAVRKELREMLWRVDQGEAANISSVPDPELKAHLADLLHLLRLRRNDKGIYGLINRSEKILSVVGFVFDEPPRPKPPPPPAPAPAPAPAAAAANGAAAHAAAAAPAAEARSAPEARAEGGTGAGAGGGARNGPTAEAAAPAAAPIGPAMPPRPSPGADGAETDDGTDIDADAVPSAAQQQQQQQQQRPRSADADPSTTATEPEPEPAPAPAPAPGPARRVAGPAMPPRELLEAAAAAAEALQAAGGQGQGEGEDDEGGLLVGPPPPELVAELEAAPQDERGAEVVRIAKVLREHGASAESLDAYAVLGVGSGAAGGEVKKRYMRLSLLIHPDKCSHPLAHEAFQALATAARVLQDGALRAALDERQADAALRRRAAAAAEAAERERAWRVARGEEAPADAAAGPSGPRREDWMTVLPPEASARGGPVSQASVRAFSQRGKTGRGDTSAWTDNPEQRAAREAQARLEAASAAYVHALPEGPGAAGGAGPGALVAGGGGGGAGSAAAAAAAAAALDSFNSSHRGKSLMEVHAEMQEKAKQEAKAARKAAKAAAKAAAAKAGDGGGKGKGGDEGEGKDWPWRPFDRDKDLDLKPKAKSGNEIYKAASGLSSKFGSGGTQRSFL